MPIHDWTRVGARVFHDFYHSWLSEISRGLNRKLRGSDYYALIEEVTDSVGPDVLPVRQPIAGPKLEARGRKRKTYGVAFAKKPPKLRFHITNPPLWYAVKKKAVTIRHVSDHEVVAVLEIVSPGNKASRRTINAFVGKAEDLLSAGVNMAIIDLFPPTPRDPEGIHFVVWGEDEYDVYRFDPAKPLTCASYIGGAGAEAFVEPLAVGDKLPTIPLFLTPEEYVPVPLEATYQAAFDEVPGFWRETLTRLTMSSQRSR
jgi:hypothetical protein